VIVDGSHNPQAAAVLAGAIADAWPAAEHRPIVVLGVLADKDAEGIVRALAPVASRFVATSPESPRALSAEALGAIVQRVTGQPTPHFESLLDALTVALGQTDSGLVVSGSLTTAGQARGMLRDGSATT